jgi:hypothetical protein
MPGDCIANSRVVEVFRHGKCTQKELDNLKILVVEVGIDRITQSESYRLLYYYPAGGAKIPWNQIDHWRQRTL